MIIEQYIQETLRLASETVVKSDKINQRLVTAIISICVTFAICFSVTLIGVSYFYFTTDYSFPQVTQNQTNTDNSNSNVEIKKGGK